MTTWLSEARIGGKLAARVGRNGSDHVAEFVGLGTFTANSDGTKTHFEPLAGADPTGLEKLNKGIFDALVRHLQGKLTLHGSAVAFGSRALAFVGPSGAGKSTFAAALCAYTSASLLADDTVAVELPDSTDVSGAVLLAPTQDVAWLLADARRVLGVETNARAKLAVAPQRTATGKPRLEAVIGLEFSVRSAGPVLRKVRGQDAFAVLSPSVIRFAMEDPSAQAREVDQLRVLLGHCAILQLERPRNLERLMAAVDIVRGFIDDSLTGKPT